MDASVALRRARARQPLAALGRLTVVGLIGIGLGLVYLQAGMIGAIIPPLAVFTLLSLLFAGLVAAGWRWTPLLGAVFGVFIVAGNSAELGYSLTHPADLRGFAFSLYILAMVAIAVGGGVAATVQNVRGGERRATTALPVGLAILTGVFTGAVLVASVTASGVNAGVSPETLASLPALTTANFAFDQQEIRVKAGETVALRLENSDSDGHSFDIDEFNVHALMPSGQQGLALFKPTTPGTYTFYCAPHYDKATGQGMKGTLIVE